MTEIPEGFALVDQWSVATPLIWAALGLFALLVIGDLWRNE